jgi:hypothetical protein
VFVIFGAHLVLYSQDAEADRRFLAEKLGLDSVDAGHGWLIFAMPPSEVAVHPAEAAGAELYFMCDDLRPRSNHSRREACRVRRPTNSGGARSRG